MKSIKLIFTLNRETLYLRILENKTIMYSDRKWPEEWQFMPKDDTMARKILMSRNRIPQVVLEWINQANSGKNLEEYNNAEDYEALVPIIKKDAASKGCLFQKRIDEEVEDEQSTA
ncbi:MAG: hypothetical protein ACP5D2_03480 [Candidatus Nanoarchaeia archaeon]